MSDSKDKWKEKYLNTLDVLETHQQQSEQQLELLQRALAKVSVAAQGQDSALDEHLAQLRILLRDQKPSNATRMSALISQLEQRTMKMDDSRRLRNKEMLQALLNVVSQLQQVAPSRELGKQLKKFARQLNQQFDDVSQQGPLIEQLQVHQQDVLTAFTGGQNQQPGFFQRLMGTGLQANSENADLPETNTDEAETLDLEANRDTREEVVFRETQDITPGFAKISGQVVKLLKNLLDKIDVPKHALPQAQELRKQLLSGMNWYELIPNLENLSGIVLAALNRDQREFEGFLKALDQRLQEVQGFLSTAQDVQRDALTESRKLDEEVRHQVSSLNHDVEEADNLETLKSSVRGNLESIVASLDLFRDAQQSQEFSVTDQLSALIDRVASMEKESEQARTSLEEQRQRMMLDNLTQLPNREAYQQRLDQEYARWKRYQRPLTLVIGDVDLFKSVNDNYGHLSGDKVLKVIAKTLATRLRSTDFVARFGGEEFVILMPETTTEQALVTIEALREAISQCPFHFHDKPVSLTMSFGLSEYNGEDSSEQVFERADKALYQAKDAGRNCCRVAEL